MNELEKKILGKIHIPTIEELALKHYDILKVIKSMKKIGLVRDDGLVSRCVNPDGSGGDMKVYSDDNALWGILLNAVGRKDESIQVVESMKNLGNLVRDDGLVSRCVNPDGSGGDMKVYSGCNALWGMLLNAVDKKDEARKVVKSMKKRGLVRFGGLVNLYVKPDGSDRNRALYSYSNALWGMLLNAVGYRNKARKVVKSMMNKGSMINKSLVRYDWLVGRYVDFHRHYCDMNIY
ncbi:hypothetical protein D6777_04785, partial [Candidatus Woesearchaeota archaeon]